MVDVKDLKSFIVFKKIGFPNATQLNFLKGIDNPTLRETNHLNLEHINEYEFMVEQEREIPSESINKFGEIEREFTIVKKVFKVVTWEFKNNPYVIAFFKGGSSLQVSRLIELIVNCELSRVDFDDKFFKSLIRENDTNVIQTTFKTLNIDQEFSVKGLDITSNSSITELEFIWLSLGIKCRVSRLGRVSLFREPEINSIVFFVEKILDLLIKVEEENV